MRYPNGSLPKKVGSDTRSLLADNGLILRNVSKSYNGRDVLSRLTLEVASGELLAILGPSGSGKTTAMRVIAGFETPDQGEVLIAGENVTDRLPEQRNVNMIFQSYALFPHLSVLENVAYGPRMRGASRNARQAKARELLELVRLQDSATRRPHELSGGMQQRVALARALANEPAVLLLDEPLGALDRKLRLEMQRELRRLRSELATTFVYVTHDQEEAFGMADRLAVMRDGRIEQVGLPSVVYDRPANAWVALFVGAANTFRARVDHVAGKLLKSDLGLIEVGYLAEGLMAGNEALVAIRPEATRIAKISTPARSNSVAARLVDIVSVGPSRRLIAKTIGGLSLEAIEPRQSRSLLNGDLVLGEPVVVTFEADAARAYHTEIGLNTNERA